MSAPDAFVTALRRFADRMHEQRRAVVRGEPEAALTAPTVELFRAAGEATGAPAVAHREAQVEGRIGRPDFAVSRNQILIGYAELKAPGKGANPSRYKGHDRRQWKRFQLLPNLIYTDGTDWALYQNGERIGAIVRLDGDPLEDGADAVTQQDADDLWDLFTGFLSWEPIVPAQARALAGMLAPLCRYLRDEVSDAIKDEDSPLVALARDWRNLLFPEADDDEFADAYAQTITFALLLAQTEGANLNEPREAIDTLAAKHSLLSRALDILTDPAAQREISAPLRVLRRVIANVPSEAMERAERDPWLYFYEHFLAAYDAKLRKDAGVYYTPIEVVGAQVRLIDDLLTNRLGHDLGFASDGVVTLDPAVGTGTYLLGVVQHAIDRVRGQEGEGAVAGRATTLARQLYAFEKLVGPYAVAEMRVSRELAEKGAALPDEGVGIYLTDTLESPHVDPPEPPLVLRPLAEQHSRALRVKDREPVLVCLGNPPYDRHAAADAENRAATGGWVRHGEEGDPGRPILEDFRQPAIDAGHGGDVKNLYNLYIYFWRWALWKVFEHETAQGPGVVSFITASSYLDGDAFVGVRKHMRRQCDAVWIIDLGGEGRGTRQEENIFAIRTPVAIAVCFRAGEVDTETPATVRYTRITGTRDAKLATLGAVAALDALEWEECSTDWQAKFRPAGAGSFFGWPLLTDLMPWRQTGVEMKRTWPIGTTRELLEQRWVELLEANDRRKAYKETRDRKIADRYSGPDGERLPSIESLQQDTPCPRVAPYAFRSLDREHLIADNRLGDYMRWDTLWDSLSDRQAFITTLLNHTLGQGPALIACSAVPDRHHFRGSYGGKEVLPLFRDAEAQYPNITPDLLQLLGEAIAEPLAPEDFAAYVYGLLCNPAYTARFEQELATREIRVPLSRDAALFREARDLGRRLLYLHTFGERFAPTARDRGRVPRGAVRNTTPVPNTTEGYPEDFEWIENTQTLRVGAGEFGPVSREVYDYEVSGLKVVQSWLAYRMKNPRGRRSSPLDDIVPERWPAEFTTELLNVLWILEHTLEIHEQQADLLERIIAGPLFAADELPQPPDEMREAPRPGVEEGLFGQRDGEDE